MACHFYFCSSLPSLARHFLVTFAPHTSQRSTAGLADQDLGGTYSCSRLWRCVVDSLENRSSLSVDPAVYAETASSRTSSLSPWTDHRILRSGRWCCCILPLRTENHHKFSARGPKDLSVARRWISGHFWLRHHRYQKAQSTKDRTQLSYHMYNDFFARLPLINVIVKWLSFVLTAIHIP